MDLKQTYQTVNNIISTVDFSKLWKGFKPLKFALYNDERCFFDGRYIDKTAQFCANTAIEYDGEYIAIWNVTEEMDADILASKMIHEMFHAFQYSNGESRFPNELDALKRYRCDAENLSVKFEENMLIAKLRDEFSKAEYEKFLAMRKYRMTRFPYEFRYEAAIEQIEGSANYVELMSLRQISAEKYKTLLEKMKTKICTPQNMIPIRVVSYAVGALLFSILKDNDVVDFEAFSDLPTAVRVLDNAAQIEPLQSVNPDITAIMESYDRETERIIQKAVSDGNVEVGGEFDLIYVNVYDARRRGNYIVTTYFVAYSDSGNDTVLNGDFVVELNDAGKLVKVYRI